MNIPTRVAPQRCRPRSYSAAVFFGVAILTYSVVLAVLTAPVAAGLEVDERAVRTLGKMLFHDSRLSADGTISCATCHQPARAFSDGLKRSVGVSGIAGTRNAPSLIGAAEQPGLFWDGRSSRMEELVLEPMLGPYEHGLRDTADMEQRFIQDARNIEAYSNAFGENAPIGAAQLARAMAAYVSTLRSSSSAFERYAYRGETEALDAQQRQGYELFRGRGGCVRCHRIGERAAPLTDHEYHNHGIGAQWLKPDLRALMMRGLNIDPSELSKTIQIDRSIAALGRFLTTHDLKDIGAFRTPSLRNVAITAPYMHDGSIATLHDAIAHELYYSANDRGAGFSIEEREALAAFLRALSD